MRDVVAIVGMVVGAIGLYLAYQQFESERPRISISVRAAGVRSADFDPSQIPAQLAQIEENYGEVTGQTILDLRDDALLLRAKEDDFLARLQKFADALQRASEEFDKTGETWRKSDIRYADGVLTLPDDRTIDVRGAQGGLRAYFGSQLVEAVQRNPSAPGEDVVKALVDRAFALNEKKNSTEAQSKRKDVAAELRRIRTAVADTLENKNRRVFVEANVENQSKLPTVVMDTAALRVYQSKSRFKDVPLELKDPVALPGYSVGSVMFSKSLDALEPATQKFMEEAFSGKYACLVLVQDLHRGAWSGECRFDGTRWDDGVATLTRSLDRVFSSASF